jgi:hypothetical protein
MNDALTGQTVELLQQMIRNQCVNDGSVESGQEVRTTDLLRTYLAGSGLDLEVYEPDGAPGRSSLVARIEGSDPTAPTLCLMGHTDVVPVTPATWARDPFGGELVNGEVWGRGAIDMLNLTATQAVALKALARQGWRPKGTLVYLACADEEAGGTLGGTQTVTAANGVATFTNVTLAGTDKYTVDGPSIDAVLATRLAQKNPVTFPSINLQVPAHNYGTPFYRAANQPVDGEAKQQKTDEPKYVCKHCCTLAASG